MTLKIYWTQDWTSFRVFFLDLIWVIVKAGTFDCTFYLLVKCSQETAGLAEKAVTKDDLTQRFILE